MATKEPTTVTVEQPAAPQPNGKVHNPMEIVWPFDQHGFTTLVRKEGARAIGRIKGNPEKLEVFIQTLKVLGEHARVKVAEQQKDAARDAAATKNRVAAQYARSLAEQKAEVERLTKLLASAQAAVDAKAEMPGEATKEAEDGEGGQ